MGPRLAGLVAAGSSIALLVAAPAGVAIGSALVDGKPIGAAIRAASLGLEALTASAWTGLFLALRVLSHRLRRLSSAPQSAIVFIAALTAGMLVFYRAEPVPARLFFSSQYAVLVVLALWLFGFLASWLPSPQTDSQPSRL